MQNIIELGRWSKDIIESASKFLKKQSKHENRPVFCNFISKDGKLYATDNAAMAIVKNIGIEDQIEDMMLYSYLKQKNSLLLEMNVTEIPPMLDTIMDSMDYISSEEFECDQFIVSQIINVLRDKGIYGHYGQSHFEKAPQKIKFNLMSQKGIIKNPIIALTSHQLDIVVCPAQIN